MARGDRMASALTQLLTPSAKLYRGVVKSVSGGLATVTIDNVDIERISYPKAAVPAAGDTVFLLGQEDFGMTIFSIPAIATAAGSPAAPEVTLVEPTAVANYAAGNWSTAPAALVQQPKYTSSGVWFYARSAFSGMDSARLGKVEMRLTRLTGDYVELSMHNNSSPTGAFLPDDPARVLNLPTGTEVWVPLPLTWGRALISGARLGLTARSQDHTATLDFDGTLRFTTL